MFFNRAIISPLCPNGIAIDASVEPVRSLILHDPAPLRLLTVVQ